MHLKLAIFYSISFLLIGIACQNKEKTEQEKAALAKEAAIRDSILEWNKRDSIAKIELAKISFEPLYPDPDSLIDAFFEAMDAYDTNSVLATMPSYQEYEAHYPFSEYPDANPGSAKFVATLLFHGNRKEVTRWLFNYRANKFQFSRYAFTGKEKKLHGHELLSGVKLFVTDTLGQEQEFPIFRTLMRVNGGYKVWCLLET